MKSFFFIFLACALLNGYEMELICKRPRIYKIYSVLSDEECEYLIDRSAPHLQLSRVIGDNANEGDFSAGRSSTNIFLQGNLRDKKIIEIEKRITEITGFPYENGEPMQVVHYDVGQEYRYHYDTFEHQCKGGQAALTFGGQRLATFLIYLNDVEDGGETHFYYAKMGVKPKKGDAILFFPSFQNGQPDPLTMHAGLPIKKGEKWIITRWFRQHCYQNNRRSKP
ncbi:MAG: 2OG-Fe(II) oxygenase [Simkaniaceae bacterium]